MGLVVVVVVLALLLAGAVIVYAAFPYRGEETPVSPLVGDVLRRGVRHLPTIDPQAVEAERREPVDALR